MGVQVKFTESGQGQNLEVHRTWACETVIYTLQLTQIAGDE